MQFRSGAMASDKAINTEELIKKAVNAMTSIVLAARDSKEKQLDHSSCEPEVFEFFEGEIL